MKYGVQEFFYSFQGEGAHMGRAAFFIRLYGCPVHCPWCDSAGTWHKDWPTTVKQMTASELKEEYLRAINMTEEDLALLADGDLYPFVVITGGEPTMYNLKPLVNTFVDDLGVAVHLETSGAFPIQDDGFLSWITVSPKWNKIPLAENIKRADEIKIIVEDKNSIQAWEEKLDEIIKTSPLENWCGIDPIWWLHPEWSKARDKDPEVLNAITEAVKQVNQINGCVYRAGYQIHKMYMADLLDPHAQKQPIPLGGDLKRGF